MVRRRHGIVVRGTALLLSWVFTATSAWAGPAPAPLRPATVLLPSAFGLAANGFSASGTAADTAPVTSTFDPDLQPEPAGTFEVSPSPAPSPGTTVTLFGPQRYVRTTGPKNVYTTTATVPPWLVMPFTIHIQNGELNGSYRVSSAVIEVNGVTIADTSNFNQNVPFVDRAVDLAPTTTLRVTLASKPTSYLTIGFTGTNADHTAPAVTVSSPAPGSFVPTTTPSLAVEYRDVTGTGEPAASGVNVPTLEVWLDDVSRTSWFTRRSTDATAQVPADAALSSGRHLLRARISDVAGNVGETTSEFVVDVTPPVVTIPHPPSGAYLKTATPEIRVEYADENLDLSTLKVWVNGSDRTAWFQVGPTSAAANVPPDQPLPSGVNGLVASIRDRARNEGSGNTSFNVDVQPPTIKIAQPTSGSRHGANRVEAIVQNSDDQKLDTSTFAATLDGNPVTLSVGETGASGWLEGLSDGPHTLAVSIADAAGNGVTDASPFWVDTAAPSVQVVQPVPGSKVNTGTPPVWVAYSDEQGLAAGSLSVIIDTTERASWCAVQEAGATCTIPPEAWLAEGEHSIHASISDLTGNMGHGESAFTVDTLPPTGHLVAPAGPTNVNPAPMVLAFEDVGTGVVADSTRIFIDGTDETAAFSRDGTRAEGSAPGPLAQGTHTVRATFEDAAGNPGVFTAPFVVDTELPQFSVSAPAAPFIGDPTPTIALQWSDATSGVKGATLAVTLVRVEPPLTQDLTALFTRSGTGGEATLPDDLILADASYHLQATVEDEAGNVASASAAFQVDTVPPVVDVDAPAEGAWIATARPVIAFHFTDDASGVDLAATQLAVDGIDRSARLVCTAGGCTAALLAEEALGEGPHTLSVTVKDGAGNTSAPPPTPFAFSVDTVAPMVAVVTPARGSYVGSSSVPVVVRYSDGTGSGVHRESVQILVDGVDRTAAFTIGDAEASATLSLGDGPHNVLASVIDWAANPDTTDDPFMVDTTPPSVSSVTPADETYFNQLDPSGSLTFGGSAQDLDPNLTVTCTLGGQSYTGSFQDGAVHCAVPIGENENDVHVTVTDSTGHSTDVTRTVILDRVKPEVAISDPADGSYTNATTIDVTGQVTDLHLDPAKIDVNGVPATVTGGSFTAAAVPVGDGPDATLTATATDKARNSGTALVTVHVDRASPEVHITSPAEGAVLAAGVVEVEGTIDDASPVQAWVNDVSAEVDGGTGEQRTFHATVPVSGVNVPLEAKALDAAGNVGQDVRRVTVDVTPPSIVITEPAPGLATRAASVHVGGTVTDNFPGVRVWLGTTPVPVVGDQFGIDVPLPDEKPTTITLTAIDVAGNATPASVAVRVDRTAPDVTVTAPPSGSVVATLPIAVQGTVADATEVVLTVDDVIAMRAGSLWVATVSGVTEGGHSLAVVATDEAGNVTTMPWPVVVDVNPPVIHITSPPDQAITKEVTIAVTGTVADAATSVAVSVNGVPAVVTGSTFATTVPLEAEAGNTLVAKATDGADHTGFSDPVTVVRDTIPPSLELSAPATIRRTQPGTAVAVASDEGTGVASVTFKFGDQTIGPLTTPPFEASLVVPDGAVAGQTIDLTAEAQDRAGNAAVPVHRPVAVTTAGAIVGQVLVDDTGLPLAGATVHMGTSDTTTDERGRYALPTESDAVLLVAEKAGMTSVERRVAVQTSVGTVPVDARLTPLATATTVDGTQPLVSGPVSLAEPAGTYRLTRLTPQGLPGLLPLGWTPVLAFDLRAEGDATGSFDLTAAGLEATSVLYLVAYDRALHDWRLSAGPLSVGDGGQVTTTLGGLGAYALVRPDDPQMAIPGAGAPLTGLDMVPLPLSATSTATVTPATLPTTGGTAVGHLSVTGADGVPSGTVVQARVTETFSLTSGDVASEETRTLDILLHRSASGLEALVPITPSRTFETSELSSGKVHLDILAGREGVRGETGGNAPVSLEADGVTLDVAKGALPTDLAIDLGVSPVSAFVPQSAGMIPFSEVALDFSGRELAVPARLTVPAPAIVGPDDVYLWARVERILGVPRMAVVALGQLEGGAIVPRDFPGLPGIRREGRYVLFRSPAPVGFVGGLTTSEGSPVRAVVAAKGDPGMVLPFVALSSADGQYLLPAAPGAVTLAASVPPTAAHGEGQAQAGAGETATANIALSGVVVATVVPTSGAVEVPTNTSVEVTSPVTLDTTNLASLLVLVGPDGQGVPAKIVPSGTRKSLSLVPTGPLARKTTYTLQAAQLADVYGGVVSVPASSFTTRDEVPPESHPERLTFSYPDADGFVTVSAPDGSLLPGTTVLIVNMSNAFVLSLSVGDQGAVSDRLQASTRDVLKVTVTDPYGNVTVYDRSDYVDPETGRTAVGAAGGVVAADGFELRIPAGAIDGAVELKISSVPIAADDPRPALEGGTLAPNALRIEATGQTDFKDEIKVAFPRPAEAPDGAFFYVYRRLDGPADAHAFETIDIAEPTADGKVVTASYPFSGYANTFGLFDAGGIEKTQFNNLFLMWTYDQSMPGRALVGAITGRVVRPGLAPNATTPVYQGVAKVQVWEGAPGQEAPPAGAPLAITRADGTFTMFENAFTDGPVTVVAKSPTGEIKTAEALRVDPDNWKSTGLRYHRNIAQTTITLDAEAPPPPPHDVLVDILRPVAAGYEKTGVVAEGTSVVVAIRLTNAEVDTVRIGGTSQAIEVPQTSALPYDAIVRYPASGTSLAPGTYKIEVAAHPAGGGIPINETRYFTVIAQGGAAVPVPGQPPAVIDASTLPGRDQRDVPWDAVAQIVFTEPVKDLRGHVHLVDEAGVETALRLMAVDPGSGGVIDLDAAGSSAPGITSLTIQPSQGLRYGATYTLRVDAEIADLDVPPLPMEAPYTTSFTTVGLSSLTRLGDATWTSPGIATVGDRVYLVELESGGRTGELHAYDVSQPAFPSSLAVAPLPGGGRAVDLAAANDDGVEGATVLGQSGRIVAVATHTGNGIARPPNVLLFDASADDQGQITFLGAASLTGSAIEGYVDRVFLRTPYLYVSTFRKGIQVLDLARVKASLDEIGGINSSGFWRMIRSLNTDGEGFGQDAVTLTIPIQTAAEPRHPGRLLDLKVGDYTLGGYRQPTVIATGMDALGTSAEFAFVVANPQTGQVVFKDTLTFAPGVRLTSGQALALANANGREIAVVVGKGDLMADGSPLLGQDVLATVDLTEDAAHPVALGIVALHGAATDVAVRGDRAFVGGANGEAQIVSLTDSASPFWAGVTTGGVASRLSMGDTGVLFSTQRSLFGGASALGEVHALAVDPAACPLLDLLTPKVTLHAYQDPLNGVLACGAAGEIVFTLCQRSAVTLEVAGLPGLLGYLDGGVASKVNLSGLALDPGPHIIRIPVDATTANIETTFQISATALADPSQRDSRTGGLVSEVENKSVLPVGHTFVKGVDLLDGHLVRQATDIKVPGRNLGLELTRTYSSASKSADDLAGAGWSVNDASRLFLNSTCHTATVVPADGSSQVFSEIAGEYRPQKGYHSQLRADGAGGYVFTDKSGTEHSFLEREKGTTPPEGGTYRIDHIRERHGDELRFRYDGRGRLVEVGEYLEESPARPVRTLTFKHAMVAGYDRIESAAVPGLGLSVSYGYDAFGNLTYVKKTGSTLASRTRAPAWSERYTYSASSTRDRHQMLSATDPNGSTTRYAYFTPVDPFGGDPKTIFVDSKEEYVRTVTEEDRLAGTSYETRFSHDATRAGTDRTWTTTVKDARGNDSVYLLNLNGSPLRIDEPLGKATTMEWSDDALKTKETDAEGRVTDYSYEDGRGNLTKEIIHTAAADHGDVQTTYAYDPKFNKLTQKTDAEGRVTTYEIDPATGDLLSMTDGSGMTQYRYALGHGLLTETVPPRGASTQYSGFTSFGKPQTVVDPTGLTTTRTYDALGEMTDSVDALGTPWRRTHVDYDVFGRPTRQKRESLVAGSDDELVETEYFPAGQPKRVRKGGTFSVTDYALDGLNRVKETTVTGTGLPGPLVTTVLLYDGNGNKIDERDARGVTRHFEYDALNRLTEVDVTGGPAAAPLGPINSFTYWPHGGKKTETDISGSVTSYEYDGLHRLRKKVFPESDGQGNPYAELSTYDKVGNLRRFVDRNGRATESDYDALNRLVQERRPLGFTRTIAYDDDNGAHVNKSAETLAPQGVATTYQYDAANREIRRDVALTGPEGAGRVYTTATQYATSGHVVRVQDPRGTWRETTFDGLDRVSDEVVDPSAITAGGLTLTTSARYDVLGNRKVLTDARGNTTLSTYDGGGRLRSVQDALGQVTRYEYDGGGLKTSETDRRMPPVTRTYAYDNLGRPTGSAVAGVLTGVAWSQATAYDDASRQRTDTDARGTTTVAQLDRMGRVVRVTDVNGDFVELTYDGVNKRTERDKRGHTASFDYDALDRLVHTKDRRGLDAYTTYRDAENAREEKDRRGIVRRTQLDPLGRVVRVVRDWQGAEQTVVEASEYDPVGNRVLQTDGEGHQTRFAYDAANRLVRRTDGLGSPVESSVQFTVDANGNVTDEVDDRTPQGTHRTFDALNRATSVKDGEGNITTYGYDGEGNRTSVRSPLGQTTAYAYEELGKLRAVTPPGTPPTTYAYDPNRNRISQTDAEGRAVAMVYDRLNRLTDTFQPLVPVLHQEYDPNGNLTVVVDPKGQTVTSTYDESDRLTKKTYGALASEIPSLWRRTTEITYAYDDNDNLTSVQESVASGTDPPATLPTSRTYDRLDRLTGETAPLPAGGSRTVSYTYFANGLRKSVTEASGPTTYTYDAQNRLAGATTPGGTATYAYFPDDLLKEVSYPNGVKASYGYDNADRLTSIANSRGTTVVSSYAYTYDGNGNRTRQIETNGGPAETTTYTYDDLDRLATVTYPVDTAFPAGRVVSYGYDQVGNRIRETEKDATGSVLADKQGVFDNLNRLTALNDLVDGSKSTVFGYDDNGNQTSKTVGGTATDYRYDPRDKMVEVVAPGGSVVGRFQYDFQGRRTEKIGSDGVVQYVYDQTSVLAEYDPDGNAKARYDYGSDRLFSMSRAGEGRRWYSLDALRSVVNLTDDSGSLVASYHLDAWGNFRFPSELTASKNRFAFTGYEWDQETGLFNAKARYFDPTIGRFTSQDSFLGQIDNPPSLHRYFYADDNPTRYWDPTGHFSESLGDAARKGQTIVCDSSGCSVSDAKAPVNRPKPTNTSEELTPEQRRHVDAAIAQRSQERRQEQNKAHVAGEKNPSEGQSVLQKGLDAVGNAAGYLPKKAREATEEYGGAVLKQAFGATKPRGRLTQDEIALGGDADLLPANRLQKAKESLAEHGAYGAGIAAQGTAEVIQGKALEGAGRVLEEGAEDLRAAKSGSAWSKGPGPRGLAIEDAVETSGLRSGRLPKGFRGVDFHEGVVTSTKSVDFRLPSYQDPVRLQRKLQGYVDSLESFEGGALKGKVIRPSDIAGKQLDIAIPPGPMSPSQRLAIEKAQAYGTSRGIKVNVFTVE